PIYLSISNILSMNSFEPLFWMGAIYLLLRFQETGNGKLWLGIGALLGAGLMNKHSTAFFGFAFLTGLVLTRDRKYFADKYLWLGGLLAFVLFLPNLIWQYENNWATLELLQNVQKTGKNVVLSPQEFVLQQMLIMLPFTAPIWLAGLWYLLFDRTGKRFRTLGIAYVAVLAIMIALKAKNYYLAPVYPILFAAGGVFWESFAERFRWAKFGGYAYAAVLAITGLAFVPLALPVLPVEKYTAYQDKLGFSPPKTEVGHQGPLPQHFGDMFGWEEMTAKTAAVYNSLPPEERSRTAIFGSNYGEAGAIDHFGGAYNLPKAISPHQSYFLWGPRDYDGSTIIVLGSKREDAEKNCGSVEERDAVGHPYAMGEEHFNILICRNLKTPLAELWPKLKHWN
ncbi:MAG TPA: glycosyltransferase family 39 protein, partial [Pyrinomonadaceae bacterium]|nr:glycosyltransferase family 39 protein [Pyrinomonadaceae bacterium]